MCVTLCNRSNSSSSRPCFSEKRRKISKFSLPQSIWHARFSFVPRLTEIIKMFTLSNIEIKIPTKVSSVHFNNLKISQLQRHLHGEGKKWVGQNRQNENARQIVISFFVCYYWLTVVVVVTFVHSFHFKTDYYDRYHHHYHYYFISDWLCVRLSQGLLWFAGTFCTCEQIWVWECVCACVCVCARGTRLPYIFLTTSTSHFFLFTFNSDREGGFLVG